MPGSKFGIRARAGGASTRSTSSPRNVSPAARRQQSRRRRPRPGRRRPPPRDRPPARRHLCRAGASPPPACHTAQPTPAGRLPILPAGWDAGRFALTANVSRRCSPARVAASPGSGCWPSPPAAVPGSSPSACSGDAGENSAVARCPSVPGSGRAGDWPARACAVGQRNAPATSPAASPASDRPGRQP